MNTPRILYEALSAHDGAALTAWGERDAERLVARDIDGAVEDILDAVEPEDWPETVLMCGFRPMSLEGAGALQVDSILDPIIESLNEDFGDSEEPGHWDPTPAVRTAAEALADALRADYPVWTCEPVLEVEVPVRAWVRAHAPHWLVSTTVSAPAPGEDS